MKRLLIAALVSAASLSHAQVLPVREQARVINEMLAERLDTVLPGSMQRTGIDMWVLVSLADTTPGFIRPSRSSAWMQLPPTRQAAFARVPTAT